MSKFNKEIKDFIIDEDASLIDAMRQLDNVARKVLFVLRKGRLAAAVTDGDIRRWILKKGVLESRVKQIANYNPKYLFVNKKSMAHDFMVMNSLEALPIVNEDLSIESIVFWDDSQINTKKSLNLPVVIMAGGLGTRLYPYTKILPKPLIPIGEIPIVEHIINDFYDYSINRFYMIVNHKKNMIKAYFSEIKHNYELTFVDEDKPLGTGGGLSLLKGMIDKTFILSNCDILIKEDYQKIVNFHNNNTITMICSLKNVKIPYGVVEIGIDGSIEKMREKPELSFFTNTGIYIVEPEVIDELEEINIGFPDIIEKNKQLGRKVGIYPISEDSWMDMGEVDKLDSMSKRFSEYD
jgi:dTDP-glucose pyrophosphorylase